MYGPPELPLIVTVALPSDPPKHFKLILEMEFMFNVFCCEIVTVEMEAHEPSVTVIVYVPAIRPVTGIVVPVVVPLTLLLQV